MNVKRVEQLADEMEYAGVKVPQFDMTTFCKGRGPICETSACIAGSAVALFQPDAYTRWVSDTTILSFDFEATAQDILGLTDEQAHTLFFCCTYDYVLENIQLHHAVAMLRWLARHPDASKDAIMNMWIELVGEPDDDE